MSIDYLRIPLESDGFVRAWLVRGTQVSLYTPVADDKSWNDQINYEVYLRGQFYHEPPAPPASITLGQGDLPWRYVPMRSRFINENTFYSSLSDVRLEAATCLVSDTNQVIESVLWTYAAVDVFVNGQHVCRQKTPVYKPIAKQTFALPLKQGVNTVYFYMQNLGVRDTRNMAALQLMDAKGISSSLPDEANALPLVEADRWLQRLSCTDGHLCVPKAPPVSATVVYGQARVPVLDAGQYPLDGAEHITVEIGEPPLTRAFDVLENIRPNMRPIPADGDAVAAYCRELSLIDAQRRGTGMRFSVYHVLARLYLGQPIRNDIPHLMEDLDWVEKRVDCSDFLVTGLIRLANKYQVPDDLAKRMRTVLLDYRYWMDEQGADGMCFWSENHALMFHASQMLAGAMYPDELFTRSGRIGRQQYEKGLARCRAWLDDTEQYGMEEFNSASYLPVTTAAILSLIDFAPEDVSQRASKLMDTMLRQLCRHVFDQSTISPQGRVYRDVITPYRQSVQDMLHFIFPDFPYANGENMWNVCFATSQYRFPADLRTITQDPYKDTYLSGHARVRLVKTADYALTSVDSPRDENDTPDWTNLCFVEGADHDTNTYTRSINERFHGTSVFQPGVYGYQQHLWYAALSRECVVFVTLPGNDCDNGGMRPDYWYGNGVFPALRQNGSALGLIYEIPDSYPIGFTHVFWPQAKFDKIVRDGHWLFGRARTGAVALWCSGNLTPFDDRLSNCEYRCYNRQVAYYCACAECPDEDAFQAFISMQIRREPAFEAAAHTLTMPDGTQIVYRAMENRTQFI